MLIETEDLKLDVNDIQATILYGNPLRGVDGTYTFYHDETNNIRKLLLTETGLNNPEPKSFVLGGVVYRPSVVPDWTALLRSLKLQTTIKELKLKHLGKGDFLDLLSSKKLPTFLKWLTQRNIHVHFSVVDVVYWSVVDIIDSILVNRLDDARVVHAREYKNFLYRVLKRDLAATSALLFSADYPDVAPGATRAFIERLVDVVKSSGPVLSAEEAARLIELLQDSMDDAVLEFIQDEERHVLISGFDGFYRHVICLFKDSRHFLDKEDVVAERLTNVPLKDSGVPYTGYTFLDSKADPGIQVADVVTGLLGKYWTYINTVDYDTMVADMKGLNAAQRTTVATLKRAIVAADRISDGFIHMTICDDDVEKHRRFFWGIARAQ
ncbi:DUF3800 domain-containing protein [Rhodanobacter sp. MP1X3]|uniref:DUF3800 domain-containing protein n=1 Tax=Rhodanobacter sp. MP1X3 TaxID=2723086 RepID=UPI001621339C|nr:DUF3800 domain-containing protein [Rhodanobacter sp. MP1X3]MBB6244113.1 hypothetical protein [Rhodanobacter sp. MP1X3]